MPVSSIRDPFAHLEPIFERMNKEELAIRTSDKGAFTVIRDSGQNAVNEIKETLKHWFDANVTPSEMESRVKTGFERVQTAAWSAQQAFNRTFAELPDRMVEDIAVAYAAVQHMLDDVHDMRRQLKKSGIEVPEVPSVLMTPHSLKQQAQQGLLAVG